MFNIGPPLYPRLVWGFTTMCFGTRKLDIISARVCRFFNPSVMGDREWVVVYGPGSRSGSGADSMKIPKVYYFLLWRLVCLLDSAMVYHAMVRIEPAGKYPGIYLVVLGLLPRQQLLCQF